MSTQEDNWGLSPIAAAPEAVFPLVATAQGFMQWWAADVTERAGAVELAFFKKTTIYRLRPRTNEPPTKVEWTCETGQEWEGTRIAFSLESTRTGTLLHFVHGGWRADTPYFVSCNTTWGELMYRLKAAAEGHGRGPLFLPDDMAY